MTAPRIASATMLSSVCETSVPSTTGRFSRGRPVRRATTSARDGSPSRAGSVEDMSTPMNVPCIASESRTRARGQRGAEDRVPREGAQHHRAAHDAESEQHERRARVDAARWRCSGCRSSAAPATRARGRRSRRQRARAGEPSRGRGCGGVPASVRGDGRRCARTRGFRSADRAPTRDGDALEPGRRRGRSRSRPRRRDITCSATRGQANRSTSAAAACAISARRCGLVVEVAQRLGERLRRRRPGRAGRRRRRARRRGSRRCPRRRPACRRRTPRSGPCRSSRRRATARTARRPPRARAACVSSSTLPSACTPRGSSIIGASSSSVGPITVSSVGMCSRSASKARSSSGRPLRSTAWPTNAICSLSSTGRSAASVARSGSTCTPLGMTR